MPASSPSSPPCPLRPPASGRAGGGGCGDRGSRRRGSPRGGACCRRPRAHPRRRAASGRPRRLRRRRRGLESRSLSWRRWLRSGVWISVPVSGSSFLLLRLGCCASSSMIALCLTSFRNKNIPDLAAIFMLKTTHKSTENVLPDPYPCLEPRNLNCSV